jgi:hypothetical protein
MSQKPPKKPPKKKKTKRISHVWHGSMNGSVVWEIWPDMDREDAALKIGID